MDKNGLPELTEQDIDECTTMALQLESQSQHERVLKISYIIAALKIYEKALQECGYDIKRLREAEKG